MTRNARRQCLDCPAIVRGKTRCASCETRRRRAKGYGPEWDRLADSIRDRDGHRCRNCGAPCPHPRHHPVDHIVPRAVDTSRVLDPTNCRTLCQACHDAKGRADARAARKRG